MKMEMLINVSQTEECRVAILEDGVLEELHVERASQNNLVGNVYKGRIVNLEPSIQAAFVDFGVGRNGFLHISDVESQYFRQGGYDPNSAELTRLGDYDLDEEGPELPDDVPDGEERTDGAPSGGRRARRPGLRPRQKPPIQDVFRRGDEVLVQVIKEGIGTKGPTLSTYISIPGRYLVLMPSLGRVGVSRKIEDDGVRRQLRDIMLELNPPKGLGFIVRTAGSDRTKRDLARDLAYLLRLWKVVTRRLHSTEGPGDIYEESDMVIRSIRDLFTAEIDAIYIDEPTAFHRAKEFLEIVMPKYADRLKLYEGRAPLFHAYGVEQEISLMHQRRIPLKQGGSIVIDTTEALVAIDVNSGNFRTDDSAEETAYQMNLQAVKEIARQLRLRDLGGVIVNDFIDMRREKNRRGIERALRDAMKRDRARTKILRTSPFGMIEMTRQRIRPSFRRSIYQDCPCCNGTGTVKTAESTAIEAMRQIQLGSSMPGAQEVIVYVTQDVAIYLHNRKRRELTTLEDSSAVSVQILVKEHVSPEFLEVEVRTATGRERLVGAGAAR